MKNKMKTLKNLMLLTLLSLIVVSCSPSVETFYYRMAAPPAGDGGTAFYRPPSNNAMLKDVAGDDVHNVILCIGDGMGFNHVALSRQVGADGKRLWMETLPISGQATTRSANKEVTDSAAAATALACGVKTNNGMIGVAPDKTVYNSILELLAKKGWRTGLVATSSISHATPASFASHVDLRNKEDEIAAQLLDNRVDVLFGGGRKYWGNKLLGKAAADGYQVIRTREEMSALELKPVVGLFAEDGMTTFEPEPSLPEMAQTAINLLCTQSKEWFAPKPKFFLMIEGSQIDWAAHANDTDRVIRQILLFDMAVCEAVEFAQRDEHTLVVVTADHETGGLKLEPTGTSGIKVMWTIGNHTAANVPIWAYGPGAKSFSGTMDNTDIAKRIAELTGIAEFPVMRSSVKQKHRAEAMQ
jgi:alkaline phosphatase